jgi:hypothetical protein
LLTDRWMRRTLDGWMETPGPAKKNILALHRSSALRFQRRRD